LDKIENAPILNSKSQDASITAFVGVEMLGMHNKKDFSVI
jgi:hypothetical protein